MIRYQWNFAKKISFNVGYRHRQYDLFTDLAVMVVVTVVAELQEELEEEELVEFDELEATAVMGVVLLKKSAFSSVATWITCGLTDKDQRHTCASLLDMNKYPVSTNTKVVIPFGEPVFETCSESTLLRVPSSATWSALNQKSVGSLASRVHVSGTAVKI